MAALDHIGNEWEEGFLEEKEEEEEEEEDEVVPSEPESYGAGRAILASSMIVGLYKRAGNLWRSGEAGQWGTGRAAWPLACLLLPHH